MKYCYSILLLFFCFQYGAAQTTSGLLADKLIFSSNPAGAVTYSAITTGGGATQWQSGATLNTDAVTAVTITSLANGGGFSFGYDGNSYTAINISNNGFITFGATAPTTSTYNPIAAATGYAGAIAGYGFNLVASTFAGAAPAILYQVTGSAPNRELVVQFQDLARTGFTGVAADKINFQIRLVETSNVIKIVYGTWAANTTTTTASNFGQVGLRGESSSDFHTRMIGPSTSTNNTTWENSGGSGDIGTIQVQTASDNTAGLNCMRYNNTCFPLTSSTLTYTWTPVAGSFYQALPYTQNFDSWVNFQSLKDAPASSGVITWPSSGHLSWRNITESNLNSSWNTTNGNFASPSTQAGAGSAAFNQYNAVSGTKGVMDFFVNFSAAGTKVADFYIRNPGTTNASDVLQVFLSTDGGASFLQIGTDIAAPTPTTATTWSAKQTLTLGTSTSSTCILRFQGVSDYGSSLENLAIDELSVYVLTPCTTPTAQPGGSLGLTSVTATSLSGSFAAASPAPSGYIVFRSTSNIAPAPVNGTTYTSAGSPYTFTGNQYTVVNTTGTGPVTFTQTGLTANTQYYYYVMSVNSSCTGQPFYLTTSPLTGNVLTCTAAPATLTGTAVSSSSATINFATVTGATSYILQYSVAGANTWVTAAPAPAASPYTLTGLTPATAYDIRMQAPNVSCGTLITTSNAFTTTCVNASLTYSQGFNAVTIPTCWTQQFVVGTTALQFVASSTNPATTPQEGADYVYWNSYAGITSGNQTRLVSAPITTTGSPSVNAKFYWFHDNSAYTTAGYADEGIKLQYSLNGTTWFDVQTINRLLTGTNGWTLYDIALPPAAGNVATMYVGFLFTSRGGDNCSLDNLTVYVPPPCTTPTDQPAALSLTAVTATSLSGSFTAASPAPSGYIVMRSTSNVAPGLTSGTAYMVGSTYPISGNNYTVVSNGTATSFTETGLIPSTQYYYYVFSFNGSCAGAPYILNTGTLSAGALTCTAAAATLTGTAVSSTSATINFSTITGAASYILQYSVAGANAWIIASPAPVSSPYTLNGLAAGTAYDIRLEGPNSNCGTTKTTSNAFTTPCAAITVLPWTEKFDGMASIGSAILPSCWLNVTGTKPFVSANASYTSSNDPFSSPNYVTMTYGNTTASYLWTPGFQLTGGVSYDFSFKWVGDGYSGWTGDVLYNTAQNATGATTLGNFVSAATTTIATYANAKYTFTPASTGTYYFATKVSSTGAPFYLGFDDYSLRITPACNYAGTASIAASSVCAASGSTTLSAIDYSVSGAGLAYQWQYSNDNFGSNIVDLPSGTNPASANTGTVSSKTYYRLRVFCTSVGYSYSNTVSFSVGSYAISTTTPATRCGIGTVTLQATATAGSTISWYTAASGGTSIGTGGSFVTPEISSTTNYYAGANDGSTSATIGPAYSGSNTNDDFVGSHGIVINTTSPNIVILSAKIPFTGKGTFTIQLQTTAGVAVSTVVTDEYTGGGSVPITIPLNIAVTTPGTYRLLITAITGTIYDLGYISSPAFPYTGLGGAFSVTSGYWYNNTSTSSLYLFSLVVSNLCEGPRTLVAATVTPPPALTLSTNAATICNGSSTTINVTTPASNFATYSWLPATGVTASGTPAGSTVALNPTSTTNYTLTATSATNCVNKATALITVNAAPPLTVGAAVCSGNNATIAASTACASYGNPTLTVTGSWNATTDATAPRPIIYIANSPTCNFDPAVIRNYVTQNFQVTVTGTYTFVMPNTAAYDGMGYIVTGPFIPGICPGGGTWIVGDDDSGPTLFEPLMSATLTAGITYTLITTTYSASSGTVTDNFTWNITGPVGGAITTVTGGTLQWYTVASGGSSISSASPFNPVGVSGSGIASNTATGSYTFYAACSNNPTCRTATGYVIGAPGQWIGASNSNWSNIANWCGAVPTIATDASISLGAPNMPVLNAGTGSVNNLAVNAGASLTITNATMQIAGTITASNTINATAGTIELAGGTTQTISGSSFTSRSIQNLVASNSVNISNTVNDSMKITGALSFGNVNSKLFNSGDNVILVSNAAGTARVADITNNGVNSGNTFLGKFVVQRYIPARRAWRLMTAPVTTGAQTINQAWQEGAGGSWFNDPKPGYGTHITGGASRTTAQGFDQGPNNPSIFGYSGTAWNYLPATTGEMVTNREGWMLFVRGSRAINLPLSNTGTVADITTLRPTGSIRYGTQPTVANAGGGFTVVGNPYPSPVNFKTINKTGVIGGVGGNAYYLWDPNLGGSSGVGAFVTFSYNLSGTYDKSIVTGTGSSSITNTGVIPSSAAFMVNLSPGGTITMAEKDKDTVVYTQPYVFRPAGNAASVRASLYEIDADGTKGIADGNLITFSERSNTAFENEDAVKMNNFQENFAVLRDGNKISIERRSLLQLNDTIFYSMWNMKRKNYELEIAATGLTLPEGSMAFLEDSYLQQKTVLDANDTTRISFTVSTDNASAAAGRFRIVIEPSAVVPVTFSNVKAYAIKRNIMVEWTVQNELNINSYVIERSPDGIHFSVAGNCNARGGNTTYNWLDEQAIPGDNFYRIKSKDNAGNSNYSRIVKVYLGDQKPAVSIYPNPVTDHLVTVSFSNMPAGLYNLHLYNAAGQLLFSKQVQHAGGNAAETISFDKTLSKGAYQMEVVNAGSYRDLFQLIIQ